MKKLIIGTILVVVSSTGLLAKNYAKVDGEYITDKDVENILASSQGAPSLDQLPKDTVNKIVKQIVERKLLAKHAISTGIKNKKEYTEKLAQIEEALATDVWMRYELGKVKVTPKEVKDFYNNHIDKFSKPAEVQARHILVKTEKEAQDIIKILNKTSSKKVEEKFIELAKEKSTGPSGKNGGELGWFSQEKMVKPFADAAFALNSKSFTKKPVQTKFGWHIIYVEDKKAATTVPFETIADKLAEAAKTEKFKKELDDKVGELVKRAKVQYYDK